MVVDRRPHTARERAGRMALFLGGPHMTMTKMLTKTKTKSLTKTKSMALTPFPAGNWAIEPQIYIELPNLFANSSWKSVKLPEVPGPDETAQELQELLRKQYNYQQRKRRLPDIMDERDNTSSQFMRVVMFSAASHPNTTVLFEAMVTVGAIVVMHYKNKFGRPRPSQLEPALRPLLDVPGHASYPSGHATQAYLVAQALTTVIRNHEIGRELYSIAEQVAVNREWAGLHYASDSAAGKQLARELFPYIEDAYEATFAAAAREWI
jgi:PAP2 superfamily